MGDHIFPFEHLTKDNVLSILMSATVRKNWQPFEFGPKPTRKSNLLHHSRHSSNLVPTSSLTTRKEIREWA